ncbi:hypothetical protein [Senegalia sp. (in: firmicutes)]|uniref:hypothetical protein n=1 Tax=Senegalia sp. (in: firmicutes) TaxID=1924098 RepID=UPI003F9E83C3
MNKFMKTNKLLDYFQVANHQALMEFIKKNPEDKKVKELKELLVLFDVNLGRVGEKDE